MERESSLAERQRKDAELSADRVARQIRLGHIPDPAENKTSSLAAPAPKAKPKAKPKPRAKAKPKPKK